MLSLAFEQIRIGDLDPEYEAMLATMYHDSRRRKRTRRNSKEARQCRLRWLIGSAVCLYVLYIVIRILLWEQYSALLQSLRQ